MSRSRLIEDPFSASGSQSAQYQQQRPVTSHYPNNMSQRIFQPLGEFDHLRFAISTVYQGFKMIKTSQYGHWGVYKAPVVSLVANIEKYIVAVVPNDAQPLGVISHLESLQWTSFQCRSTKDINKELNGYYIAQQGYTLPRERNTVLYDKVKKVVEYDDKCVYLPEHLPLKIEIIKEKPDEFIADEGNIIACLEVYNTILTLQED
jgi:hypothetical protein